MSSESSSKVETVNPAARAAVLMRWRADPAVVEYRANPVRPFTTFAELSAHVMRVEWGQLTLSTWLKYAAAEEVGFDDLSPAEREVIGRAHPEHSEPEYEDPRAARWVLFADTAETGPLDLPDDDPAARLPAARTWAAAYRERLPHELRHLGMLVLPEPGKAVVVAVWFGAEHDAAKLRAWVARVGGKLHLPAPATWGEDEYVPTDPDRFRVLRSACTFKWAFVALEPAKGAPSRRASFTIQPTGVGPLDALLATRGIPRGTRVYVQAATAQGKSVFNLHVAEHFAAAGLLVAWVATSDESVESINARRLQRIGYGREEALRLALEADATALGKLHPNLKVIDGSAVYLEDVIATAPDLLVLDPVQKVLTRAGEGSGQLEAIGAAVRVAEQSGVTLLAASSKVRGAGRRAKIEAAHGGAFVENGATLLLDLALDGDRLSVSLLKSRYGGEGQTIELALDRDGQRVTGPGDRDNVRSVSEAETNRDEQVLAALAKGPKTARALRTWVAGNAGTLAASLERVVQAKKATLTGDEYALCEAP